MALNQEHQTTYNGTWPPKNA